MKIYCHLRHEKSITSLISRLGLLAEIKHYLEADQEDVVLREDVANEILATTLSLHEVLANLSFRFNPSAYAIPPAEYYGYHEHVASLKKQCEFANQADQQLQDSLRAAGDVADLNLRTPEIAIALPLISDDDQSRLRQAFSEVQEAKLLLRKHLDADRCLVFRTEQEHLANVSEMLFTLAGRTCYVNGASPLGDSYANLVRDAWMLPKGDLHSLNGDEVIGLSELWAHLSVEARDLTPATQACYFKHLSILESHLRPTSKELSGPRSSETWEASLPVGVSGQEYNRIPFPTPAAWSHYADLPIRVSEETMFSRKLAGESASYPPRARAAQVSGAVVIRIVVAHDGTVKSASVESGPELLRASALDAVRTWRFRPMTRDGIPTEVATIITMKFHSGL